MTNPQKDKGDRAELAGASLLSDLTGFKVVRKLGAGRAEDTGDLWGIPDTVIQVAHWADPLAAIRAKVRGAEAQRINAGATFAAALIKLPRWGFVVCQSPEQYATYVRESLS